MSSEPSSPSTVPATAPPTAPARRWPRFALTAGVLVALGVGVAWYVRTVLGPAQARDEALRSARAGRFAQAEQQLVSAIERDPEDAEVAEALATGYLESDNSSQALAALDRWIGLQPKNRGALRRRFEFHQKSKDPQKAYADGRALLDSGPADEQLARTVTLLAFSLGRFDEAEVLCRKALTELPGDRRLRSLLADIRRARGDLAEAGTILDRLLQDFPGHTPAMLARGVLYLDTGEPAKAIPLLREVLRTDPTRQRTAGYKLAVALERCGQADEARRVTETVRRLQAVAIAEEGLRSEPDNVGLAVRYGEMLLAEGFASEGVRHLEAVVARHGAHPDLAAAHRALADHYDKTGQADKAADHRRRAAQ